MLCYSSNLSFSIYCLRLQHLVPRPRLPHPSASCDQAKNSTVKMSIETKSTHIFNNAELFLPRLVTDLNFSFRLFAMVTAAHEYTCFYIVNVLATVYSEDSVASSRPFSTKNNE